MKKTTNGLATKKDLKETEERLDKKINAVKNYFDFQLEPIHEFVKEFKEFKNNIFDKLDWLIGRYRKFDEELAVKTEQEKLEKRVFAS